MPEEPKYYCEYPGCLEEIPKPIKCCNSYDCGCMGLPIDPPFCEKCINMMDKKDD